MSFNPFDLRGRLKRAFHSMAPNPFKPETADEIKQSKEDKQKGIDELTELFESAESIQSDSRFSRIMKKRKEQLAFNVELLKTTRTIDPIIAEIQGRVSMIEEVIDFAKLIKLQLEALKNEKK